MTSEGLGNLAAIGGDSDSEEKVKNNRIVGQGRIRVLAL